MGVVNFVGPLLTRRVPVLTVVAVGQGVGSTGMFLALLIFWSAPPGLDFFLVGAAAGVLSGMSTIFALRAGQVGHIGLVSVILALSAVIPVLGGIIEGDQPPLHQWIGIALAAGGTGLTLLAGDRRLRPAAESASLPIGAAATAQPPHPALGAMRRASRNWPLMALLAAAGFGVFMLVFAKLSEESLLWTGFVSRFSMAITAAIVMLTLRPPVLSPGGMRKQLLPLPFLGLVMAAAILLFGYSSLSMLTVAAALTAFAPVVTVALSWILLRERLTRAQIFGIAITICGLCLIAV